MFVAMLIYMGVSKPRTKKVCQMVFRHSFLGEIDDVLDNVDNNLHLPLPQNYYMFVGRGIEVKKYVVV